MCDENARLNSTFTPQVKSLFLSRFFASVKTPTVKSRFKIINIFFIKPVPVADFEEIYFFENPGKIDCSNVSVYF